MILVNLADIYVKILLIYFDYQASPTGQTETEDVYKDYLISNAFLLSPYFSSNVCFFQV